MKNGNIIEQTLSPMIVFWDAVGGLVFGALIGAFIHTGGEDLDRPQADVLMKLKCESRYPQEEPEFLKMLK